MSKKKSQKDKVLAELQKRKRGITSWDMITKHRITRLSHLIYMLKKEGYKITSELEAKDGTTYSRYKLEEN